MITRPTPTAPVRRVARGAVAGAATAEVLLLVATLVLGEPIVPLLAWLLLLAAGAALGASLVSAAMAVGGPDRRGDG